MYYYFMQFIAVIIYYIGKVTCNLEKRNIFFRIVIYVFTIGLFIGLLTKIYPEQNFNLPFLWPVYSTLILLGALSVSLEHIKERKYVKVLENMNKCFITEEVYKYINILTLIKKMIFCHNIL